MTNYEKIKQMSVEEMAKLIDDGFSCADCNYSRGTRYCFQKKQDCVQGIIEYLESEAVDDGNAKQDN